MNETPGNISEEESRAEATKFMRDVLPPGIGTGEGGFGVQPPPPSPLSPPAGYQEPAASPHSTQQFETTQLEDDPQVFEYEEGVGSSDTNRHPFEIIAETNEAGTQGWRITKNGSTIVDRTNGGPIDITGLDTFNTDEGYVYVQVRLTNINLDPGDADVVVLDDPIGEFDNSEPGLVDTGEEGRQNTANLFIGRVASLPVDPEVPDGETEFGIYQATFTPQILDYAFYNADLAKLFSAAPVDTLYATMRDE